MPSGSRLVATRCTRGHRRKIASAVLAQPPIRCSQLSSTISTSCGARASSRASSTGRPGWAASRSAAEMAGATASWSVTAASSTSHTPSPDPSSSSAATCSPSRVLPHPPAPVKVTSRAGLHQRPDLGHLPVPADERRQLGGQIVRQRRVAQRPQRRELRRQARRRSAGRSAPGGPGPSAGAPPDRPAPHPAAASPAPAPPLPPTPAPAPRTRPRPPGRPGAPPGPPAPAAVCSASPQWMPIRTRTRSPPGQACVLHGLLHLAAPPPRTPAARRTPRRTHPPAYPLRCRRGRPAPTGSARDDRPAPARRRRPPPAAAAPSNPQCR